MRTILTSLDGPEAEQRKPGPRGISSAQVEGALRRHAGVFSLAARELGISRQAVHDRVRRSPELQSVVEEISETLLDAVDAGIADLIVNKRDPTTLRWYADRKGAKRGYGCYGSPDASPLPKVVVVIEYVDAPLCLDEERVDAAEWDDVRPA